MIDMVAPPRRLGENAALISGLNRLARNLWWTWNQESQEIFEEISPPLWRNLYHNAVAVLREISEYELSVRLNDQFFRERVQRVLGAFDAYMSANDTWGHKNAAPLLKNPVAYFTAEYGFHETLPIAAGGLGILAGDHARSASDLGLGMVGVSLFYREGYFQQSINQDNWQTEYYTLLDPKILPMEPVLNEQGERVVLTVDIDLNRVYFQAWRVHVGRVKIYLLDSDRVENDPLYRDLTLRVYGGDSSTRIMQEMLLGLGGVRLLRTLGITPSVFQMNEGHVAFLSLELIREKVAKGLSFPDALEATRKECIFTTHTPVAAGHDRFSPGLIEYAMHRLQPQITSSLSELMALGRVNPSDQNETFCMTVLGLKTSRSANGVSELHGQTSRKMWHCLYPDRPVDEVPIGHITNGIHVIGWMKGPVRSFWKRKLGPEWERIIDSEDFWSRIMDREFVTDDELWALRYRLRRSLIEFARFRTLIHGPREMRGDFIAANQLLDADTLTIGFARRFATYKRAPLIFEDLDAVVRMVKDPNRPIQFIFAGKAHPRDDAGKRYIQHIIHLSKFSELKGRLLFLENYDVHIARQMVSGCDLWLNNPRRPLEASGTSGQKIGCNGGLNLGILDGWWREGYDGANGFAIGEDAHPNSIEEQDRLDRESLYRVLSEHVIPCFYDRDDRGIPRRWIAMIRRAMATLVAKYDTSRMVREYTRRYYLSRGA